MHHFVNIAPEYSAILAVAITVTAGICLQPGLRQSVDDYSAGI